MILIHIGTVRTQEEGYIQVRVPPKRLSEAEDKAIKRVRQYYFVFYVH